MGPSRVHPKKGCTTIYEKPCQDALSLACVMQAPSTARLIKEETEKDRVSMTPLFAVWLWTRHLPSLILQSYSTPTVLLSPTLKSTVPGAYKYKQPNFFLIIITFILTVYTILATVQKAVRSHHTFLKKRWARRKECRKE